MSLLEDIRSDRALQRTKSPLPATVFNTVGGIVKAYELGEDFLVLLNDLEMQPTAATVKHLDITPKKGLDLPPYGLFPKEQYDLILNIMARVVNPYLRHARTPEEILLCTALYRANPSLDERTLQQYDFDTLLRCERAREELTQLERLSESLHGIEDQESQWNAPGERRRQLRAFVAGVEHRELQPL